MLKNGVGTPALHEVFIKVKGELRIVDEELREMAIVRFKRVLRNLCFLFNENILFLKYFWIIFLFKERRKCYFQNELKLERFTKYTLVNCQSECRAKVVAANCQCQLLLMSSKSYKCSFHHSQALYLNNLLQLGKMKRCVDLQK